MFGRVTLPFDEMDHLNKIEGKATNSSKFDFKKWPKPLITQNLLSSM